MNGETKTISTAMHTHTRFLSLLGVLGGAVTPAKCSVICVSLVSLLIVGLVSGPFPRQVFLSVAVGSAPSTWVCPPLGRLTGLLGICSSAVVCILVVLLAFLLLYWLHVSNFDVVMMSVGHLNPSPEIFGDI